MTTTPAPVPTPARGREVVVGVDGSAGARRALDLAVQVAVDAGVPLRVVHAYTRPLWVDAVAGVPTAVAVSAAEARALAVAHADGWVARALSRCGERRPVAVVTQVVEGRPGDLLVRASEDAALLVIGRRTHGPIVAALLDSATAPVLHHAACPVLVVPGRGPATLGGGRPHRVVVGVDGSAAALAALRWAAEYARREQVPVVAARAWTYDTVLDFPPALSLPEEEGYAAAARAWLRAEVARALPDGPPVEQQVHRGRPTTVLQQLAGAQDLLDVGTPRPGPPRQRPAAGARSPRTAPSTPRDRSCWSGPRRPAARTTASPGRR